MASRSSPARSSGVRGSNPEGDEAPKAASHDLSITPHEGGNNDVAENAGYGRCRARRARARDARSPERRELQRGDRATAPQSRAAELADVPRQLQRLGIQPARADHPRERKEIGPGGGLSPGGPRGQPGAPPRQGRRVVIDTAPTAVTGRLAR